MELKNIDPWYIGFWISIIITIVWAILKIAGVINTPFWLEMLPVFSGLASVVTIVQHANKYLIKIEVMDHRLIRGEGDVKEIKGVLKIHDKQLVKIEKHLRI